MINLNILIIEDDSFLCEKLKKILSRKVLHVNSFYCAKEALEQLDTIKPDVIITDIKMPQMSGLEMVEIIRNRGFNIKIIIASAFSESHYFQKAIKLKVENFLVKPIDIEELLLQLQEIEKILTLEKAYNAKTKLLNEYKAIVDKSNHVTKTDLKGNIIYANDRFCKLCGYSKEELLGKPHNIVRHEDMPSSLYARLRATILDKKIWHGTIKSKTKNGVAFYVETSIAPILDEQDKIIEFISIKNNVTEFIKNKRDLQKEIVTDRLTNLPNRIKFTQDLSKIEEPSIILIDIEKFHETNNLFGLDFGDQILIHIAKLLKKISKQEDLKPYRISADEFIILNINKGSKNLENIIHQFEQELKNEPFEYKDINFEIDLTYSIVISSKDIDNNMIISMAESALMNARKHHKLYTVYTQERNQKKAFEYNFEWTQKIKQALIDDRIDIFYQPIVSTSDNQIKKFECLVRYIEKDGTVISPYYFLNVAKRSRLYNDITKVVIQKACQTFSNRKEKFSINLSIEDIMDKNTIDFLIQQIQQYKLENKIVVEILESEGIDNYTTVIDIIEKLKSNGVKIAIDDFGTGYSNFAHLISLDIDILKIDGSLIKNILNNQGTYAIVKSILSFTKELNIETVAEFVCSKEIHEVIQNLGVDFAQGYYWSEPISKEQLKKI